MDWELSYLSVFKVVASSDGRRRDVEEVGSWSVLAEESELYLQEFLEDMVRQAQGKKASLSPAGACRAWNFKTDESGREDRLLMDELLNAISRTSFHSHATLMAERYSRTPKARDGLLFVLNANLPVNKHLSPCILILKSDFRSAGLMDPMEGLKSSSEILLPELKKCLLYPHFDGLGFQFEQVRIFQSSRSEYFERLLHVSETSNSDEIADESLETELESIHPETYSKYFSAPEEERRQKRDVFGDGRFVEEVDLLDSDRVAQLALKTQMRAVDRNTRPLKLRLTIDDGLKFEGNSDQFNRSYFFARHGLEKVLIVRGQQFQTKSHYQTVEFLKLETLDEVIRRLDIPLADPEINTIMTKEPLWEELLDDDDE